MLDKIIPTSVVNHMYSHGMATTIKLYDNHYLVPHSYEVVDSLSMNSFKEYDLIEIKGDEFFLYKCFLAHSREEAFTLVKQAETNFYYHLGSKHFVSEYEGLGDK